jgi:hypothetical protein
MLLLSGEQLAARRLAASGPLAPLAASLTNDLSPLLGAELNMPLRKPLLSREGGRCPACGVLLEFDPYAPRDHRCPACGETFRGDVHDLFWAYWYQLWLAERAVHAALFAALDAPAEYARLAARILGEYVDHYAEFPNSDNVLGPSRMFFSTYLESIWLLQVCIATDFLDGAPEHAVLCGRLRDRVIEPARSIIAGYDEGMSNRQVWNNAALIASARLLDRDAASVIHGASGVVAHLRKALLPDGTWYEGENYHLFAHRGLWYCIAMAQQAGVDIPAPLIARFDEGFVTPFLTALPDFTLPARRDSQFAISLRQWRLAEHTELGFARTKHPVLGGALQRMYDDRVPAGDTGRWRSAADVERNRPPVALSRADLSWRALVCALPVLPPLQATAPRSALLESQGLAVFRRNAGRSYVALDYGHHGGGHGHPDRLNLLLADDATRWLDDMGTGSYVEPALHWYRSTAAHNAPLVNGQSQQQVHGTLIACEERDAMGWISARAAVAPGVEVTRTVVVASDYLLEEVRWSADRAVDFELPMHVEAAAVSGLSFPEEALMPLSTGPEDGAPFVHDATVQYAPPGQDVVLAAEPMVHGEPGLHVCCQSDLETDWFNAIAPAAPGLGQRSFWLISARGTAGVHRALWSWMEAVADVELGERTVVQMADGTTHIHTRTADGWRVELRAEAATSSIELGGVRDPSRGAEAPVEHMDAAAPAPAPGAEALERTWAADPHPVTLRRGQTWRRLLGAESYRRSEQSWAEAGRPTASVALTWSGKALSIDVEVSPSDMEFAATNAVNPYDNEHPDVNGDGVQLYVGEQDWMLVPETGSTAVRVRELAHAAGARPAVRWARVGNGYQMHVMLPVAPGVDSLRVDVLINEMPRGRMRRRGQFVLGGARDEFVYLRGDRNDRPRFIEFKLSNV